MAYEELLEKLDSRDGRLGSARVELLRARRRDDVTGRPTAVAQAAGGGARKAGGSSVRLGVDLVDRPENRAAELRVAAVAVRVAARHLRLRLCLRRRQRRAHRLHLHLQRHRLFMHSRVMAVDADADAAAGIVRQSGLLHLMTRVQHLIHGVRRQRQLRRRTRWGYVLIPLRRHRHVLNIAAVAACDIVLRPAEANIDLVEATRAPPVRPVVDRTAARAIRLQLQLALVDTRRVRQVRTSGPETGPAPVARGARGARRLGRGRR